MSKVRALAPLTDKDGNPVAAGAVVDIDDETAADWRAAGKVAFVEDEERSAKAAESGNYNSVTGRADTAGLGSGGAKTPGPQADDDDEDEERPKRSKK